MAEQHIRIMCPNVICRKVMSVPVGARGKIVQCPQCRKRIRIPLPHREVSPDSEPAETESPPEKKKAG